ncbi:MAG TPA: CHASE3 domain-containing protein, partial [Polyangiales bacterium]
MPETASLEAKQLRTRLIVAVATPVLLLLALGGLLGLQVQVLNQDAEWVDHTDKAIATTYEALKGILDQETGVRGYMLTSDPAFLGVYHRATPQRALEQLEHLVQDNQAQQARVRELRSLYGDWLALARGPVETGDFKQARELGSMWARKQKMDRVRELSQQVLDVEQDLRHERATRLAFTRSVTSIGSLLLLIVCALVIAFVVRRQLANVAATYDTSLGLERQTRAELADESWVREQQIALAASVHGDLLVHDLCSRLLTCLAQATGADVGAIYLLEGKELRRAATYAQAPGAGTGPTTFLLGEGILGQAAQDGRVL